MTDQLTTARSEAVQEVTSAMLTAAGEAMARHGNDPLGEIVLSAAVAMFIERVDEKISRGFKRRLVALLSTQFTT